MRPQPLRPQIYPHRFKPIKENDAKRTTESKPSDVNFMAIEATEEGRHEGG